LPTTYGGDLDVALFVAAVAAGVVAVRERDLLGAG
jgi:hypothetical protein